MNRKGLNFFWIIIALITGVRLFKDIDFQKLTLAKPLLDGVYLLVFGGSVVLLIRDFVKRPKT